MANNIEIPAEVDNIARLYTEYAYSDKGEELANVHADPAFKDVYDYNGLNEGRFRLNR